MFNYIQVNFPQTDVGPSYIYSADIYQNRYEHEVVVLKFREWGIHYDAVASGSPVHIIISGSHDKREFFGYVHHIQGERTPGKNFTKVVVIGASFTMKQQAQTIYTNTTADAVVAQIAKKHKFAVHAVPHPRVYPQIAQAGHTDWELMVRLAKQCGYSLRAENTELYFEPVLHDFTKYRDSAMKFVMRHEGDRDGSTIYSFSPMVGESLPFEDAYKSAIAVSGVDDYSKSPVSITQQLRNKKTRKNAKPEFFDKFDTSVVATDLLIASSEAEAAENRNAFPYRATVEVLGEPLLRPNMPIFLDGLSDEYYSGYWVVLGAEHCIRETEKNVQTYTTRLTVGTDSLGRAETWVDGDKILGPNHLPARKIIPNVRQTNRKPVTQLSLVSPVKTPQLKGDFGFVTNRQGSLAPGATWQSKSNRIGD